MFKLVVLPCFDLCRSNSFNISTYVCTYMHNFIECELESACLSGQVRPPLYSFDSTQPLSCLGSSVVRSSA